MPNQPQHQDSNHVSLRDYFDRRFEALTKIFDVEKERLTAIRDQLTTSMDAANERLREHTATQFRQIDIAFISAEKLELSRLESNAAESRQNFKASSEAITKAEIATREAMSKADVANEKRFASVNEFRAQLADQAATFIPRKEAEQLVKSNTDKIEELKERMDRNEGRGMGASSMWGFIVGGIGLLATIIAIVAAITK